MPEINASFYHTREGDTLAAMTHPSYYDDPLAHTFVTTVSAVDPDGAFVTLAETLFYPEGGGQPADICSLGGAKVVDVQKDDTGTIHHYLASPPDTALQPGDRITGTVDMAHRWDYMQQHTGQHVLSAALAQVAEAPTVSVHQGSELTTIEVDQESLSESVLEAVEDRANKIVRADLPVRGFWIDHTELPNYALRRPTSRTGKIRLVEIDGVDLVACGGVHLPRTGLLNAIHLSSVERIRGRLRLGFKIGDRAIADYREKDRALSTAAEQFSAHPLDVPARVSSLVAEVQELHRTRRLQARRIAELLFETGEASSATTVRTIRFENEDPEVFSALADTAADRAGTTAHGMCILNVTDEGIHWALATGMSPFPQKQLRADVLEPLGAKGGGKPPVWRGIIKENSAAAAGDLADEFARRFEATLKAVQRE